jgi:hypothetical protein
MNKADAMLQTMKDKKIKRDISIYTALMKCHSSNTTKIELLYKEMKDEGIKDDVV